MGNEKAFPCGRGRAWPAPCVPPAGARRSAGRPKFPGRRDRPYNTPPPSERKRPTAARPPEPSPGTAGQTYTILRWQACPAAEWESDDSLDLWDGVLF